MFTSYQTMNLEMEAAKKYYLSGPATKRRGRGGGQKGDH